MEGLDEKAYTDNDYYFEIINKIINREKEFLTTFYEPEKLEELSEIQRNKPLNYNLMITTRPMSENFHINTRLTL